MSEKNDGIQISGGNVQIGNAAVGKNAQAHYYATQPGQAARETEFSFKHSEASFAGAARIFLSHSSKDNEFSTRLARDLRHALRDDDAVWCDVEGGLNGGDAWWSKIKQELNTRPIFLVVLSPDALTSDWVNDETTMAWNQKNSPMGKRIIPILYHPCKVPADLATLQIISFLPPEHYEVAFNKLLQAIASSIKKEATRP